MKTRVINKYIMASFIHSIKLFVIETNVYIHRIILLNLGLIFSQLNLNYNKIELGFEFLGDLEILGIAKCINFYKHFHRILV